MAALPFGGLLVSRRRLSSPRLLSPMSAAVWTSAALGVALGLANAAAGYALRRMAGGRKQATGIKIVLGGMVVRMGVVLVLMALVLVLVPVSRGVFVAAFFTTFAVALGAEIFLLQRRPETPAPLTPADG